MLVCCRVGANCPHEGSFLRNKSWTLLSFFAKIIAWMYDIWIEIRLDMGLYRLFWRCWGHAQIIQMCGPTRKQSLQYINVARIHRIWNWGKTSSREHIKIEKEQPINCPALPPPLKLMVDPISMIKTLR